MDFYTPISLQHFVEGHPTEKYPDPIPANGAPVLMTRRPIKRKNNANR